MEKNKQLFEKQSNSFNPIFPLVRLEDIIETISDKSIQWILNNYNHLYVEYSESKAITRNKVPSLLRRKGLWITYNANNELITEYYNGDNKDVLNYNFWTDDVNWERFDKIKHLNGSIEYNHLSEALKQLIGEGNNITNFPDEEDITTDGIVLSFKDRDYEPANFSGLGRVILRKNIILDNGVYKNILTQDMISKLNTVYEIRYDYDLNGVEITIPEGCTLDFQGGTLSNGVVVGNDTALSTNTNGSCILCDIEGNFKGDYIIDIFGVSPSNTPETNSERIKRLHGHISHYKFGIGKYKFSEPISYYEGETYAGIDKKDSVLEFTQSKGLIACSITNSYNQYVIIENMTIQSYDSCIDRNTVVDGLCNNYSYFNNLILKSDNGHCFTQSVPSIHVYSDKYYNIIGTCPNGAVFHNVNLWLGTNIDFVCNKTSKYIFYNCYFKECNVSNCNFGWGGNGTTPLHIVYNDANPISGGSLRQSLNFINCNFEEFNSNLFVFLNQNSVFDINFDFCDFNMGNSSLVDKDIYVGDKSNGNIKKERYTASNSNYVPIIGYNINVNCDNCKYEINDTWDGFVFTSIWYSYLKDVKTFDNLNYYIFYKTNTLNKLFTKANTNNKLQVYNNSLKNTAPQNTVYPNSEFVDIVLSSYKPTYFSASIDGTYIYGNVFITNVASLNINTQDINKGYTNMYYVIVNKSSVLGVLKTSNYGTIVLGLDESVLIYRGSSDTENHVISIIRKPNESSGRINNPKKGENCFDTTLNKPIWWNGTKWVDATGADV